MAKTLYVTYTPEDLAEHAKEVVKLAKSMGWEVVIGPEMGFARSDHLSKAAAADAILLLSAYRFTYMNDESGRPVHVDEWEAALNAGKPARALLPSPDAHWKAALMEHSAWQQLQLFQDQLRKIGDVGYFDSTPESVVGAAKTQLTALNKLINQRTEASVFVVWDSTMPGLDVILASLRKRPPAGIKILVPALDTDVGAGEVFRDQVLPDILNSDQVLVITDRPNANVAFEAGLALGFGKPISLVHFGPSVPEWIESSVFKGFVVNPLADLTQLKEALQSGQHGTGPWSRQSFHAWVGLCFDALEICR